jgi:hypothetical protein
VELADAAVNAAAEALLEVSHRAGARVPGSQVPGLTIRAQDWHDTVGRHLMELERSVVASAGREFPPDAGAVEDRQHRLGGELGPGVPAVVEMRVKDRQLVGARLPAGRRDGPERQEQEEREDQAAGHGPTIPGQPVAIQSRVATV